MRLDTPGDAGCGRRRAKFPSMREYRCRQEICASRSRMRVAETDAGRRAGCASRRRMRVAGRDAGRGAGKSGCCSLAVDGSLAFL
jgi:hypothetical protein